MQDLKDNKLFWAVIVCTVLSSLFIATSVVIVKVTNNVIKKLQKEYSPAQSPYGPGLDPDKINLDGLKTTHTVRQATIKHIETPRQTSWREDWEKARGFNPGQ